MTTKPLKISIIDDHSLFSEGLSQILSNHFETISITKFQNIESTQAIDFSTYDLIISDIELPKEDVFSFFKHIKTEYKKTPILVVSMHNKLSILKKCKNFGIEGYILKDDHDLIIEAVRAILNNETYYSTKVQKTLLLLSKSNKLLTPKEEEIIALISKGKKNQEIATALFVSINTVTTHRKNINHKLNISNVAELIKYYNENYL